MKNPRSEIMEDQPAQPAKHAGKLQVDFLEAQPFEAPQKSETVRISREDYLSKLAPVLQRRATERLDQLVMSTMTVKGLSSYPEALAIVRKENPLLVQVAFSQPAAVPAKAALELAADWTTKG